MVALFIAILLWFNFRNGVAPEAVYGRREFKDIPVRAFLPPPSETRHWIADITDKELDIVVEGARNRIDRLAPLDIVAYIDLTDITAPGAYVLPIKIVLPDGLRLLSEPLSSRVILRYIKTQ
jgi:YbbR domain-containing protein